MKRIKYIYVTYRNPLFRAIRWLLPRYMDIGLVWAGRPRDVIRVPLETAVRVRCKSIVPIKVIETIVFRVRYIRG